MTTKMLSQAETTVGYYLDGYYNATGRTPAQDGPAASRWEDDAKRLWLFELADEYGREKIDAAKSELDVIWSRVFWA